MRGRGFVSMPQRQGGWVSAAISAVSAVTSFLGAKKAEKSAERQAEEEKRLEGISTQERIRKLGVQERTQYGETLAGYASGGVQARSAGLDPGKFRSAQSGSPMQVIQEAAREFARERKFTEEVGATKASQISLAGKAQADAYRYQGYGAIASGAANIYEILTRP